MLILLCGDAHITGRSPIARSDDLVIVQFEKWKEIVSIANKYNCPIVSTGDIFNTAIIANSILSKFGDILEKLNTFLFFVWGNHDLLYHNLEMLERTSLGMLKFNNPKIKHISEFKNIYNIDWGYIDWNQPIINESKSKFLLTHQAIVTTKMIGGKNSWISKDTEFARNIETDKELQKYNLIICGHWHKKYTIKYKETTVINPGPITRLTVEDLEEPTIQLINLKTKLRRTIHLESVMPTESVISNKHLEYDIHKTKSDVPFIKEFIETLKNNQIKLSSSFLNNLMAVLDSHELDKKVENLLRELIIKIIEKKAIILE
jgi:predicted phosphodiesterase